MSDTAILEDPLKQPHKAKRIGIVVLCVLGSIIVMLGTAGIVVMLYYSSTIKDLATTIRADQIPNTERNKNIDIATERILSCTTPEGACSQANAEAQAEAVTKINEDGEKRAARNRRYAVYSAFCADQPGPQTLDQLELCIDNEAQKYEERNK